jgi:hypothetical protein
MTPSNWKETILPSSFDGSKTHASASVGPRWRTHKLRWLIAGLLGLGLLGSLLAQTIFAAPSRTPIAAATTSVSNPIMQQGVAAPAYPLKINANGRYLVDQNDAPFLMVGDSPQAMFANLSTDDAELFVANRQKYGFNTLWVNLLCNDKTGCKPDGTTYDNIAPFTSPGDLSTPNDAYFSRADRMVSIAARYGMVVLLDPIETSGWLSMLKANGQDKAYAFGQYLGQRYAAYPNIIWMSGNDFQSWHDPADDAAALAVARGIKDADPGHLQTVELNYYVSASRDDPNWPPLIGLDAVYTYMPTYAEVLHEYNQSPPMPIFMVEANYEYEHDYSGSLTLRRQEYWTLLSGGVAGQLYGNKWTWPFASGWKDHLDTPGSAQMSYVLNLFGSRRWYDLVPDQDHALLTDGYGSSASSGNVNDNDYATAARTADGTLAMVYAPTSRTLTVDLSKMAGPVAARWYDPASGSFSYTVDGSPLANSGTQKLQTPGKNADGDTDWVLVLEASAS